ncbi:MAG: efflux RND transporter periplasmic adaptor subunit [Burkholderiales bacterium]|nr:efflux RND transporter periplasmic adaptor subunit [Burkholderiales bacterium]
MFRSFLVIALFFLAAVSHAADVIETARVGYYDAPLVYSAEGVVEAARQSTVSSQISGRVAAINFDVGDAVKKGQVLVGIDAPEVGHALNESRALLAQAQAAFENARSTYARTGHLFERKFVSQAALDKARAEYEAAKSQVDARRANVGIAASTGSHATVVAPYSGIVAARHVEIGEMVYPGKPLMTGFDPKALRVTVNIPQRRLEAIRANDGALILFGQGNFVRAARITILPVANVLTHTTQVRLDFPLEAKGVYPGMFARAEFDIGRAKKLMIPSSCVLRRSEVTAVYVIAGNGRYELRQVRLGEAGEGGKTEVLAGLSDGETIALNPVKAGIQLRSPD